ncbi:hypothetical protein JCM30566_16760 [Marinitoga arctica]
MKKRTLFLLILFIIFLLTSCFNFKNSKNIIKENLNSIIIEKSGNEFIVKSNIEADSFELIIENIDTKNIYIPSEFLKIIKKEKYLKVAISSPKTIHSGDIIMKINKKNFKIINVESYNRFSITKNIDYYDKGVSFGLLGDFDFDGKVGISDFSSFTSFYGNERVEFNGNMKDFDLIDIGPAINFSHKGIWNDIFDLAIPDGKISLSDFSIFAFNYNKNIISSQPTIVVNENTNISEIQDNIEKNIVKGLKQIPTLISTITDFITNNPDLINSISSSFLTESSTPIIKYLINMTDATETSLLAIVEDINEFSNLLGNVQYGYLYNDIKLEINNFDWDGDGTLEPSIPLKLKVKNNNSIDFYELFYSENIPEIIGIVPSGGDAIFDYESFTQNVDENYTPIFNDDDYILIDEGTAAGISLFTNIIGIIGKALFIYDLNNPSLNIKNAIDNNENLEEYISNLLIDLLKNPPPIDSEKILGEELQNSIFGNMLIFRDDNKSIELINNIKDDILSLHDLIKTIFEDKIMDYIKIPHDFTSGEKPPVPDYIFNDSMEFLKEMEFLSNLINNPSESVKISIGYNQYLNLHPGIFFDNPSEFSDLNLFLPDISLISTYDSTKILFELPDPTFKGLIDGLDSTFTINMEDFGKEQYIINLYNPLNGEIFISTEPYTSLTFSWENINNIYDYSFRLTSAKKFIESSYNYIENFDYTQNNYYNLELKDGIYLWLVETNDLEYSKNYISPIRSFNILKNNNLELEVNGPSNLERSTPLDIISFSATSLSNSLIKYYVLIMNDWGEVYTKPNIFEHNITGTSGDIIEIELWKLFNGQQNDGIYYYAIIADDGNNIIISPVKSFMYDNTLYNNFVRFNTEQINLTDTATFSIMTKGNNINDVKGLEIHLKVDPELISIDSSSLKIGSSNGFIKSSIKSDNWNNEEYMEIIISIYSDSSFDLSNTEIAEFEINKKGFFTNTFIYIIDSFVLFKDDTTPIRIEVENNLEIIDSE